MKLEVTEYERRAGVGLTDSDPVMRGNVGLELRW